MHPSDNDLTDTHRAANHATWRHIHRVNQLITNFAIQMLRLALVHDQSKLAMPEVEGFSALGLPSLAGLSYGTPEYAEAVAKYLGPALAHHYANNRHHPEHWPVYASDETTRLRALRDACAHYFDPCSVGADTAREQTIAQIDKDIACASSRINGMTLQDINEMFFDWKAASERHADGNIRKSIAINAKKHGICDQLCRIFENTIETLPE